MSAIELTDLTRDFGRLRAVDHLSLRVPTGEVYGLLGRTERARPPR